ncbi:enolase C-terminal domain-like protein [Mycobacterium lacus]|uniref:Mandelate racemase/muconate lactonizing enzyme C-terminal domain-containing protein n=1 Tax=Mycobacterium lacus TaxID=169765 RepID=A0A7I7NJX7_9MYCO|nr:enolase C-terminal domain-like protein [Mycobacterium lacus]MCV7125782.1 hypothetical protein [Mycobacterium lacus]BBX96688.1 hypothetical protein MLAC_19820 [Mycobacterium lacus]
MTNAWGFAVRSLRIPLRVGVRQASFHRAESASIVVAVARDAVGVGEGCPRPYQTGEDIDSGVAWLNAIAPAALAAASDLAGLREFVWERRVELDQHPAAWCALELALLDALAREAGCSVERLLDLPETTTRFVYTLVLSDGPLEVTWAQLKRGFAADIRCYKVKLGADAQRNRERLDLLWRLAPGPIRVRLDANNLWGKDSKAAIRELGALAPLFYAVEEPLAPRCPTELARVARQVDTAIILDESLCTLADLALYGDRGVEWIANLKVSRCGGLLRAIELARAVQALSWPVVVGGQVGETSLLTRAGMVLARAVGDSLAGIEGGAGELLLARDPVRPVLQFGAGGVVDLARSGCSRRGFGLDAAWASTVCMEDDDGLVEQARSAM